MQDSPLLFVDNLVLRAPSEQGLQRALDQFSAACDQSSKKTRYYVSSEAQGNVRCK